MSLLLQAVDVVDRHHWRWLLVDGESGVPLADHQVALDPADAQVAAFENLYSHIRWNADPQRRTESETELVARLGAWIGEQVLGSTVGAAIVDAAPVTVRVVVPPEAEFLLFRPLELAHVGGTPLALRGEVTLVFQVGDDTSVTKAPVGDALRMLAVFSLPTETSVLALRWERYELSRLVRRVLGRQRRVIELEVLQYGVTRERLATIMESGGGWDVLHLSGHGGAGEFLLENAAGSPDPISTPELLTLLRRGRHRIKLAVVSACQSAAATTAETLRWLRLDESAEELEAQVTTDVTPAVGGVARELARELGCAVVAMRYPVTDDFAVDFAEHFYQRLFDGAQPVDSALARAVSAAAGQRPSAARPAISAGTPAVFGSAAIGMLLTPPTGEPKLDPQQERMSGFPAEPERFVGRGRAMATASAALASGNEHTGVLFHGMAGAGKTACALELAYRHQNVFSALAFWSAPKREDQWQGALESLAGALEAQLDGFAMLDKITSVESLARFLPRLNRWLEGRGLLLVLDNLESLLTPAGGWRDPRWELLMPALLGHRGESRAILTSRIVPVGLDPRVLVEPVHALSRDEAVLLARELPNLRALLHADPGPVRDGGSAQILRDRELVRDVLHVVQGHPKLLELADAAAADRDRLREHLAAARARADEHAGALTAFLRTGLTNLDAEQLATALDCWTRSAMAALPKASRLLLQFLACLEEDDRMRFVLEATWADLWRRLERTGDPPPLDEAITPVVRAALVHADGFDPANPASICYRLHPGIAETVRAQTRPELRDAIARGLVAFWVGVLRQAGSDGAEASKLVSRAGLAATLYLIQLGDWHFAGVCLAQVQSRTSSPSTIQILVSHLRRIAAATGTARDLAQLGAALRTVDPREAETLLRDSLRAFVRDGDFAAASVTAGNLVDLLITMGRLLDALETADLTSRYTVQAGLGPWTQLGGQCQRLQVLVELGRHEQVLAELPELQRRMAEFPEQTDNERVMPWSVREATLQVGRSSAQSLERWEVCLSLNEEIIESKRTRHADPFELASTSFNSIPPLIELGRVLEAESLLNMCQRTFEEAGDFSALGKIFGLRAGLENARCRMDEAVVLQETAIRLAYLNPNPSGCAIAHHQLAIYLWKAGQRGAAQRAHRLAAALIFHLTGATFARDRAIDWFGSELDDELSGELPATVAQVIESVEQGEGICFRELLEQLGTDPDGAEAALASILETARARAGQHLTQPGTDDRRGRRGAGWWARRRGRRHGA